MHQEYKAITALFKAALFAVGLLTAMVPLRSTDAADNNFTVTDSTVIQGSVNNSTIQNIIQKLDPADLVALTKTFTDQMAATTEARVKSEAKAAELAKELGFTKAAVAEFFKILGEKDVSEEKLAIRLIEIASHFAQTREQLAALESDDPLAADLARLSKEALDAGRLSEADHLLEQAKEVELAALRQARELKQKVQAAEDRHALNAAKLIAGRGSIASTQLRHAEAAERFMEAAALVPPGHPDETAKYRSEEAESLFQEGVERGEHGVLQQAIEIWHLVLNQRPRDRVPLDWAATQDNLAKALWVLGVLDRDTTHLKEAIATFQSALEERTRDRVPLDWAETQSGLAAALIALGTRESDTTHFKEVIDAYRAALEVRTRERVPLDWATSQLGLAAALTALGKRESDRRGSNRPLPPIMRFWRNSSAIGSRLDGLRPRSC